jgi:hypothetical protein
MILRLTYAYFNGNLLPILGQAKAQPKVSSERKTDTYSIGYIRGCKHVNVKTPPQEQNFTIRKL